MIRACVIGWPIRQSRSPLIHGFWIRRYGLSGSYDKLEIAPEGLKEFVARIGPEFAGCNVTVPHKEEVMAWLDGVDGTARAIGAVNTIWHENGKRLGTNTDITGFLANLDQLTPGWDAAPLNAVVLGAGGAARAVAYGLAQRRAARIAIVNRSVERAEDLVREFGANSSAHGYADLPDLLRSATLLVNATSLGMTGKPDLDVSLDTLNPDAVVNDLVYVPLKTRLLEEADRRGNRTVDGLGMLLHQAVPAFAKWFGVTPEVTPELRALIEVDIGGTG